MSQNSLRLSWTFEEVDERLHNIMVNIYHSAAATAEKYGMKATWLPVPTSPVSRRSPPP